MSKYYFPNLKNNQKSKIFIKSVSWQFCNMQLKMSKAILQLNLFSVKCLLKQFIMINKGNENFQVNNESFTKVLLLCINSLTSDSKKIISICEWLKHLL